MENDTCYTGTVSIPAKPADSQTRCITSTIFRMYILPPDDGLLIRPKHVRGVMIQ
jgi:hypothetical protein